MVLDPIQGVQRWGSAAFFLQGFNMKMLCRGNRAIREEFRLFWLSATLTGWYNKEVKIKNTTLSWSYYLMTCILLEYERIKLRASDWQAEPPHIRDDSHCVKGEVLRRWRLRPQTCLILMRWVTSVMLACRDKLLLRFWCSLPNMRTVESLTVVCAWLLLTWSVLTPDSGPAERLRAKD